MQLKILKQNQKNKGGKKAITKSTSKGARNENIGEMLHKYKAKGSIGNTKPKSFRHAVQIASAAAYGMQRDMKNKGSKK